MVSNHFENLHETDMVQQLHDGDQYAFDFFYKKFYSALCFFSTRFTANRFVSEEIVQDSLFKLWERHSDFYNLNAIKAFLYITTRNASLDFTLKEQRKSKHNSKIAELNQQEDNDPFLDEVIYVEVLREIALEVAKLPEQCGKIIKMIYEDELKPQEIADKLHITVSTVYNQKMRGLSILKSRLSGKEFDILVACLLAAQLNK